MNHTNTYKFFSTGILCVLCFCVFNIGSAHSQNRVIDSIQKIIKVKAEDTNRVWALHELSWQYLGIGWFDSSLTHINEALKISNKLNFKRGMAAAYNIIGLIYSDEANYVKALENYFKALKINEETGNKKRVARNYSNIGSVYNKQKDYTRALEYYSKALKLNEEFGEKRGQGTNLHNMGIIYSILGENKKALEYFARSLKIDEETGNKKGEASTMGCIGIVYMNEGDNGKAREYYFKAAPIYERFGDYLGLAGNFLNISSSYFNEKNFKDASLYLKKSLQIAYEMHSLNDILECENAASKIDSATGNYKSALEHYKKYVAVRDSIANTENTKKQTQIEMQYDFDKKSAADSIKNSEAKKFEEIKHQQEISKQRTFTFGGVAGFLVMIVVAGISFRAFKNKQKANILIEHQKSLVEEKQKEILDSIYYARRIQRALITSEKYIGKNLNKLNQRK